MTQVLLPVMLAAALHLPAVEALEQGRLLRLGGGAAEAEGEPERTYRAEYADFMRESPCGVGPGASQSLAPGRRGIRRFGRRGCRRIWRPLRASMNAAKSSGVRLANTTMGWASADRSAKAAQSSGTGPSEGRLKLGADLVHERDHLGGQGRELGVELRAQPARWSGFSQFAISFWRIRPMP